MRVSRKSHQARVFYRTANRKVIETLKLCALQAENMMESIVEITPNSGAPQAGGLSLQIQDVAEYPGFPEESSIPPCTLGTNVLLKLRNHSEAEGARSGNFLVTTDTLGLRAEVTIYEFEKRQLLRTSDRRFKKKVRP